MTKSPYKANFEVRDYECDIQGRVNNAIYLNYLEHTRHLYLKSIGINFADMSREGRDLVIARFELDYKAPLFFDDKFYVTCRLFKQSKLKLCFEQEIYKITEEHEELLVLKAKGMAACVNKSGRPIIAEEFNEFTES